MTAPTTAPTTGPTTVIAPQRFQDPSWTARGEARAAVRLTALRTLWFNTGTLCNIACARCYIESGPRNDALSYLRATDAAAFLDEIARERLPTEDIGFTGGEPFMNPEIAAMLGDALERGFRVLVLTNAMRPMMRHRAMLAALHARHPGKLTLRVSLDHCTAALHDAERGQGGFAATLAGLRWLAGAGLRVHVAGRADFGTETEGSRRAGYAALFAAEGIPVDAADPVSLMLFPEMDAGADVPEITEACWGILHKSPDDVMCASARMVVRRRGAVAPAVLACTLLAYDGRFELGATLRQADRAVPLNHPHCAKFCVLGGAACSR